MDQSLSRALDVLNVQRQAYQGGTFVGNHVNKLLKAGKKYYYNDIRNPRVIALKLS